MCEQGMSVHYDSGDQSTVIEDGPPSADPAVTSLQRTALNMPAASRPANESETQQGDMQVVTQEGALDGRLTLQHLSRSAGCNDCDRCCRRRQSGNTMLSHMNACYASAAQLQSSSTAVMVPA